MDTIKRLFRDYIRYPIMTFVLGIKNLFRWHPIIWKDRDWDHYFIEHMLYHKLIHTYNFFISEHAVTDWDVPEQDKALRALRICITILERRSDNFYLLICSDVYNMEEIKLIYEIEKRDQKLLGKLIGEYLNYWWD